MKSPRHTEILLESGTNELEILEFDIAGQLFGINVAKIREIMLASPTKPMQRAHPDVEGVFRPRDEIITVIDLARHLGLPPSEHPDKDIFIITNFNQQNFAFHVHAVAGIARVSWANLQKPDKIIYGGEDGIATAIAQVEGRLVTILDFEKIVAEISPRASIQYESLEVLGTRERSEIPILVVEDSMLLSKMIIESLHRSGYVNTTKADNGQEAWNFLNEVRALDEPLREHVACIISDIEMPLMDGHRLTKLVKEDSTLKKIPVILFSSLINEEMRLKGERLGADAQISKPEIAQLVLLVDRLTEEKGKSDPNTKTTA